MGTVDLPGGSEAMTYTVEVSSSQAGRAMTYHLQIILVLSLSFMSCLQV